MDRQPNGRDVLHLPTPTPPPAASHIELRGVETNNLRGIDVDIPHRKLTVITGVSGSGKSSLAFDTLYAEGQRRFLESMSTYARQFLQRMEKPPLRAIRHVLPAIALRQKGASAHTRSTVGTVTELDDHLQMLYAHIGEQRCPDCGATVDRDTVGRIMETLEALGHGARLVFVAHVAPTEEEESQHVLQRLVEQGWRRFYKDGKVETIEAIDVESLLASDDFPILIDRLVINDEVRPRLVEAIENGMELGGGTLEVVVMPTKGGNGKNGQGTGEVLTFHRAFRCNGCGAEWVEPQPAMFNPNTTLGACPTCTGFGRTMGLDMRKVVPNPYRSLSDGAVVAFETPGKRRVRKSMFDFARAAGIPLNKPWRDLDPQQREWLTEGRGKYKGIRGYFKSLESKRNKASARIMMARYRGYAECEDCGGARLSRQARHVLVAGEPLHRIYQMPARDALAHFENLQLDDADWAAIEVLYDEVVLRLRYMTFVGLGYLRMDRKTRSLSGGEFQRIHLTSSIGRALTDTLYVLDEPTAGLHARDSERLLEALTGLRDLGNTVVVVEHDPEIIEGADHCIEIGPRGGEGGGLVLYEGDIEGLRASDTATGRMLTGRVERPEHPRRPVSDTDAELQWIRIFGASEHNLRNVDVAIPLHRMVCVTGVSGSGKSTLISRVLHDGYRALQGDASAEPGSVDRIEGFDHIDNIVLMAQTSMGRSSRSNPATYAKAYDPIRKVLANTNKAKESGIAACHFSFNSKGGRCEVCEGTGTITVEMQFMADVELQCESCGGKRFTDPVLAVEYRGKNIADILDLTVSEALAFFKEHRAITRRLQSLADVGLGYLRLGQTTATLSGGELQRLKLAGHIMEAHRSRKKAAEHDLFIFDEPTVGLHLQDVEVLVSAIQQLVDAGHSVVVVEHNVDFIAAADHVIDLGPDGGDGGGQVVAVGTPETIAACEASQTGRFLRDLYPAHTVD